MLFKMPAGCTAGVLFTYYSDFSQRIGQRCIPFYPKVASTLNYKKSIQD
jgi:hypothetical protein